MFYPLNYFKWWCAHKITCVNYCQPLPKLYWYVPTNNFHDCLHLLCVAFCTRKKKVYGEYSKINDKNKLNDMFSTQRYVKRVTLMPCAKLSVAFIFRSPLIKFHSNGSLFGKLKFFSWHPRSTTKLPFNLNDT